MFANIGDMTSTVIFSEKSLPLIGGNNLPTLARTDLLCMLNWGTKWTMVSYLKK